MTYVTAKAQGLSLTVGVNNAQRLMPSTSDVAIINAAITEVSVAGGGTVELVSPALSPSDHIRLKSNVTLISRCGTVITLLQGKSIVMFEGGSTVQGLTIDATNHVVNDKAIQISDNGASIVSDIVVENCRILNCAFGVFTSASNGKTVGRVLVTRNYITGRGLNDLIGGGPVGAGNNLATGVVTDFIADGNTVIQNSALGNNYKFAINMVKVKNTRIINNTVEGGVTFGSEQSPHVYSIIANNTIKNPNGSPTAQVGFLVDAASTAPGNNIVISGNSIENGFIAAINSNPALWMRGVVISGNTINSTGVVLGNSEAGIKATSLEGALITGNTVNDSSGDGIWLANTRYSTITGNTVSGSTEQGIKENNGSTLNVYTNNNSRGNTAGNLSINSASVGFNTANVNPELYYGPGNIGSATPASNTAVTFRRTNGKPQFFNVIGNITASVASGTVVGEEMTLALRQNATGGFTLTWSGSNLLFGAAGTPQLASAASSLTTITLIWNGSVWFEKCRS